MTEQPLEYLLGVRPDLLVRVQGAHDRGDADEDDVGAGDDAQHDRCAVAKGAEAARQTGVITPGPSRPGWSGMSVAMTKSAVVAR